MEQYQKDKTDIIELKGEVVLHSKIDTIENNHWHKKRTDRILYVLELLD